jgi:hypothetical protein
MYRPADLKTGLLNLWGWRQNQDTEEFTIADSLTETSIGAYFQEVHPLVTLDNIKAIAPDFKNITYPTWGELTEYRKGDRVTIAALSYRAKEANVGQAPESTPAIWERFEAFSEWLEEKTQASILKAIRTFWDEKMAEKTAKNLLESKTLFNGTGRINDLILNADNLVGFELTPVRAQGVTTKIEKIGLQMTGTGNVRMFLLHSSQKLPIRTLDFARTKDGSLQWFSPTSPIFLPYLSADTDAGGSWYLVYKQSDLQEGVQAVNKTKDWSKGPCGSCDRYEVATHRIWSKYLEVHPFRVKTQYESGTGDFDEDFNEDFATAELLLWDVSNNLYTYTSNYGINLQLSIECDVTDLILQQKEAFQNLIGLQVAADMVREFAYNANFRVNRTQQNFNKSELLYELDGDSQGFKKSGIRHELDKALKAVKLDTTALSRVCLPCNNKGVRFRTV